MYAGCNRRSFGCILSGGRLALVLLGLAGAMSPAWVVAQVPVEQRGTAAAVGAGKLSLEERTVRLERLLNSRTLLEIVEGLERLQREIQQQRGELEMALHTIKQLKQRQRELYLDVDRRLQRQESLAAAAPTTPDISPASGADQTPVVTTPASESTTAAPATPVAEQNAYQRAFDQLKAGRYGQAITAFEAFLLSYPAGDYADNARYWLGESHYVTRHFQAAVTAFTKLVEQHPTSPKYVGALLKIGFSHYELGQQSKASRVLKDLVARYPSSTHARQARKRLQLMRAESKTGKPAKQP